MVPTCSGAVNGEPVNDLSGAGTIFQDTNPQGTVIASYASAAPVRPPVANTTWTAEDAYGNDLTAPGAPGPVQPLVPATSRGFLNKTTDATTGLMDMGLRKYDPTTGTFGSVDSLQDPTNPQQWNGYSYANGNHVTFSDPTGAMYEPGDGPVCSRAGCNYGGTPGHGTPKKKHSTHRRRC